jgi:anti-sigma factor RsiW
MDYNTQLKLQSYLDGELPENEARNVADRLSRDREVAALAEELRNTRGALVGFEAGIRLPESREFFWSKVQREIQRSETPSPRPATVPLLTRLRWLMVPASAFALVLVTAVALLRSAGPFSPSATPGIETALADAGAFTYRDYSSGTTLVWLSYPADKDAANDDDASSY